MSSEAVETLLQIHEDAEKNHQHKLESKQQPCFQNLTLNHLNSYEILKYAMKIIQVTPRLHSLCFSLLPFYALMVFYEIIIPQINDYISKFLVPPYLSYMYDFNHDDEYSQDLNIPIRNLLSTLLELFPFYIFLLPLLEFFSLFMIINSAQKIYESEALESLTLNKETNIESFYNKDDLKRGFNVTLLVQLFSIFTLVSLIWTISSYHLIAYWVSSGEYNLIVLISIVYNSLIFVAILYKYLEWSAFWNMGIVISVLRREVGDYAVLEMSTYYGKHRKNTGLRLMFIFFAYSIAIRLPFLFSKRFDAVSIQVVVAGIGSCFICIGSLVKWVVFVVYYNDCKAQMRAMKVDEVGKAMKDEDDLSVEQRFEGSTTP